MQFKYNKIAIVGSTGGLGQELSRRLASQGYDLIFINRNYNKSIDLSNELKNNYKINIDIIECDLQSLCQVKSTVEKLKKLQFDALILNAGIYNVPKVQLDTGYNNIFQTNFISQYFLARQLVESRATKKIVAVGSIAYNYAKLDLVDIDYSKACCPSKIYGNSKRFLMCSLYDLLTKCDFDLSVVHPGVTLTNMTNHFPKFINWFVKIFIKLVFPKPSKAVDSLVLGVTENTKQLEWIGPKILNVWGKPDLNKIKISLEELKKIGNQAEIIYQKMLNKKD